MRKWFFRLSKVKSNTAQASGKGFYTFELEVTIVYTVCFYLLCDLKELCFFLVWNNLLYNKRFCSIVSKVKSYKKKLSVRLGYGWDLRINCTTFMVLITNESDTTCWESTWDIQCIYLFLFIYWYGWIYLTAHEVIQRVTWMLMGPNTVDNETCFFSSGVSVWVVFVPSGHPSLTLVGHLNTNFMFSHSYDDRVYPVTCTRHIHVLYAVE